jgi:enamine deaminase RidA (YjgF/YER057c/UK114 family)
MSLTDSGYGLRFVDCTGSPDGDGRGTLERAGVHPDELLSCEVFYDAARLDVAAAREIGEQLAPGARLPVSVIPTSVGLLGEGPARVQATAVPTGAIATRDDQARYSVSGPVVSTRLIEVPEAGDIVDQSHAILDLARAWLGETGTGLDDVVKFNIFYKGEGTEEDWARAARVRAGYYTEPGPATTGIPVPRFENEELEIAMQVLAIRGAREGRRHSWPDNHWDWPFHLPYKHGCRADDVILIGGQVPLNGSAGVLAPGDFAGQVRHSLDYIDRVLRELAVPRMAVDRLTAFAAMAPDNATERLALLRAEVDSFFHGTAPALVPVPLPALAYPGMDIEIEVQARLS